MHELTELPVDMCSAVESHLWNLLVMHLNTLHISHDASWTKLYVHARFHHTRLNPSRWNCSDASNLVHILQWQPKRFVNRTLGRVNVVQCFDKGRTIVPSHVFGSFSEVLARPGRDGDEFNFVNLVAEMSQVARYLVFDLVEAILRILYRLIVHLVHNNHNLSYSQCMSQQCMFSRLAFFRYTGLELSLSGINHQKSYVGLRRPCDHILDKISVAWCIYHGVLELIRRRRGEMKRLSLALITKRHLHLVQKKTAYFGSLKRLKSNVNSDATFTFCLETIQHPSVFE